MAFLAAIPAWVGPAMAAAGAVSSVMGGMSSASAAKEAGARQKTANEFEAAQLDQAAGQAIATSQREAEEQRRNTRMVQSRALALSAASGGGTMDPTVVNLIGDIAGEGAYRAGVALYQGADKARQLGMASSAKRYEGDLAVETANNKAKAYRIQGITGALGSASSLFGKFGAGGPGAATTASGGSNLILDAGISNPMIG
jgi:uncharacterized protein YfiM (DUF2279 family)